jgi:2-polyprenyl-6-methoxyphenol hydroxylase-like FAD-dependent oxidoreductase
VNRANPIDVLIVGAGPTGLTLACQLRRLGVDFRIIDKNQEPSTTSKAIGLQYRVSEVLTWMGLFDRFLSRGVTGTGVSFYAGGERILHLRLDRLHGMSGRGAFEPKSIVLPQSVTESLLIEDLAERGGEVERGTSFVEFTQESDGVVSRVRRPDGGEEVVGSRYLVGCEGPHSAIRKQAGLSFEGKTYPVSYFMADVELDWEVDRGDVRVWIHEDGMFSAIPMPGERRWRLFVESGKKVEEGATEVTLDLVRRLMAERTGDRVTRATSPTWLSEFRISCRMVDRFANGRVFLAGDAAHVHSPTGGQGITTGVQDAYNLAWKLDMVLRGVAPDSLLDTYTEERLPVVRRVLKNTDQTASVFLAHSRARRLFRDHVVLPLLRSRTMQRHLTRRLSQLDINYRRSSLSVHQEKALIGGVRVHAGDRTPDVVFRDAATGEETTLFERLGRSRPIALFGVDAGLDAGEAGGPPPRIRRSMEALGCLGIDCSLVLSEEARRHGGETLIDTGAEFRRLYGVGGEFLYLIRPDGYVGLFQRPVDERALQAYAAKLFGTNAVDGAFGASETRVPVEAGR